MATEQKTINWLTKGGCSPNDAKEWVAKYFDEVVGVTGAKTPAQIGQYITLAISL